jgi:hypothetical protein
MQDWEKKRRTSSKNTKRSMSLERGGQTHSDKDTEEGTEQRTDESDQPVENGDSTAIGQEPS